MAKQNEPQIKKDEKDHERQRCRQADPGNVHPERRGLSDGARNQRRRRSRLPMQRHVGRRRRGSKQELPLGAAGGERKDLKIMANYSGTSIPLSFPMVVERILINQMLINRHILTRNPEVEWICKDVYKVVPMDANMLAHFCRL